MITYKMHFIRSGSTGLKRANRFVGRFDAPLCAKGEARLLDMREKLSYPDVEAVFTSPLFRCAKTAEILYPGINSEELPGLIDMDLGEFTGKSFDELRGSADFSAWINNSLENPPPGGEDMRDFTKRVVAAASGIFFKMMDQRLTNTAVVTHSGVIMTLLAAIGLPKAPLLEWACKNGEGYTLAFTPQMWMQSGGAEVLSRIPKFG